jgi:acetyl esterase
MVETRGTSSRGLKRVFRIPHPYLQMIALHWAVPCCLLLAMNTSYATPAQQFLDVEYAAPNGLSLQFDAAIPAGDGPFPAAILVHGGGWVRGDRRVEVKPLFEPLSDAGIAWFSISYRLATDPLLFGAAVNDVEAAVRFVKAHSAEYRVDPGRLALIGESAGGQLAAMAALDGDSAAQVKAVVALYAPMDLVSLAKNSQMVPPAIRNALNGTPWESLILARLSQLSPIEHVRAGMPPFLLVHGTADALVPYNQSVRMRERITAAGAACELYPVQGAGHGIRWWESSNSISMSYKQRIVEWLKQQLSA